MSFLETNRERILGMCRDRAEFQCLEDGYWYYWHNNNFSGAISAVELRFIADELDRINAEWDRIIKGSLERLNK